MRNRLEALMVVTAVVTLPVTVLAVLFVGPLVGGTVVVVGWLLLVPLLALASDWLGEGDAADQEEEPDPLAALRNRYVRGELTEAEFERRVERLLESEPGAGDGDRQRDGRDRVPESESER